METVSGQGYHFIASIKMLRSDLRSGNGDLEEDQPLEQPPPAQFLPIDPPRLPEIEKRNLVGREAELKQLHEWLRKAPALIPLSPKDVPPFFTRKWDKNLVWHSSYSGANDD